MKIFLILKKIKKLGKKYSKKDSLCFESFVTKIQWGNNYVFQDSVFNILKFYIKKIHTYYII